jgi:hypothetical protein
MKIRIEKESYAAEFVLLDDADEATVAEAVVIAVRAIQPRPVDPVLKAFREGGSDAAAKALNDLKH